MAIEAEALRARLEAAVSEIHGHITTPEGMAAWNRLNDADVALRSALAEDTARAVEGWRPIETAPREQQPILLALDRGRFSDIHRAPVVAFWSEASGDWARWDTPDKIGATPTHWRPLPAPPALPLTKEAGR